MPRRFWLLIFFPALCGLLQLVVNTSVFNTSYDQLHELTGAANLFFGQGYVGIDGMPVRSWPPFYSLYIALWLHLHNSFYMVAAANAILVTLVAASWSHFVLFFAKTFGAEEHDGRRTTGARAWLLPIASVAAQLMIVDILRFPSAPAVFALFLPWFIKSCIRLGFDALTVGRFVTISIVSMLFANSHNMAPIVILAFSCVFFSMLWFRGCFGRAGSIFFALFCGSASWVAVRQMFKLSGSHEFAGFFQAGRDWHQAVSDLTLGFAHAVIQPAIIGGVVICTVLFGSFTTVTRAEPAVRTVFWSTLASVVFSYVILFVTFMSVPIDSSIDGRFLLLAFLTLFSLLAIVSLSSRRILAGLAIVTFVLPLIGEAARIGKWVTRTQVEGVYQRYDYVIPGAAQVDAATIQGAKQVRCMKSECSARSGLSLQAH